MKKDKKTIVMVILAMLLPILYKVFNFYYYKFVLNEYFLNLIPQTVRNFLGNSPLMLDAIFCLLMIIISVPLYLWSKRSNEYNIDKIQKKVFEFKDIFICLIIALGIAGVTIVWQIVARYLLTNNEVISNSVSSFDNTFASATTITAYIGYLLSVGIVGPIVEEYIFRGYLFNSLNKYLSGVWVAVVSGLYFGLWHSEPLQVVYTAIMGIILGLIYNATRNLWFPMIIHLINNLNSSLPPSIESNEIFLISFTVVKLLAIIPMFIIVYKIIKNKKTL